MPAYYNEWDSYAAAWIRNLVSAGLVPAGDVDERSIVDVRPDDLRGYTQVHFFAGIGGWAYAARLAGWDDSRELWTGSCPCQPFSAAGKQRGTDDERHLWPEFHRLIAECGPPVVMGEQVASKAGRSWLASVRSDLEGVGYRVAAADICAAGVGAPHIRQRLWWVADAAMRGCGEQPPFPAAARGGEGGYAHLRSGDGFMGHADSRGRRQAGRVSPSGAAQDGDTGQAYWRGHAGEAGFWSDAEWIPCRDNKARPAKPGIQPLAYGVPGRVGKLRAAGNAIVPQVAAQVIGAFMDVA